MFLVREDAIRESESILSLSTFDDNVLVPDSSPVRQCAALFRTFADCDFIPESYDAFVGKFGSLLSGIRHGALDSGGQLVLYYSPSPNKDRFRESCKQILAMRRCIRLTDLVRDEDERNLARHIQWRGDPKEGFGVFYDSMPGLEPGLQEPVTEVIASANTDPATLQGFKPGDVFEPAMELVRKIIDDHLAASSQGKMFRAHRDLSWQWRVGNLRAALWLQFAEAASKHKQFAKCRNCQSWFEMGLQTERGTPGRTTRQFCSNRCKVKAQLNRTK